MEIWHTVKIPGQHGVIPLHGKSLVTFTSHQCKTEGVRFISCKTKLWILVGAVWSALSEIQNKNMHFKKCSATRSNL